MPPALSVTVASSAVSLHLAGSVPLGQSSSSVDTERVRAWSHLGGSSVSPMRRCAPWTIPIVVVLAAGCSGETQLPSDSLGSNGDDGRLVSMGHQRPDDGIVTHGITVVWNTTDADLTLVDAHVSRPFGGITTIGEPKVVDERRSSFAFGSYDGFPLDPEDRIPAEAVHELAGFVLPPAEVVDGLPTTNSVEILIGLQADGTDLPAGVLGACVTFRNDRGVEGEKCVDHQLVICEDDSDCPIGAELEQLLQDDNQPVGQRSETERPPVASTGSAAS